MYAMSVSSHDIAARLADHLRATLPAGLSLHAEGATLEVRSGERAIGGSPALQIIDDHDDRSFPERIETATRAALSAIQDVIIEATGGPWPGQSVRGPDLPQPDCRCDGTRLFVWFGDVASPVLSIPPIVLG
jgi:hypothetical protein